MTMEQESEIQSQVDFELEETDFDEEVGECSISLEERVRVIEAVLFVSDRPVGLSHIRSAFGDNKKVANAHVKEALKSYEQQLEEQARGIRLHTVSGGYQLRTDEELKPFLQNTIKARSFRLTGPSLETLALIAYKQPCTKADVDDVRGVDSGHLVRALMDRGMVAFAGKSELPGKPMLYKTTSKFLEIFGLRNIKELPSLSEIEALLPDGIGDEEEEKETLSQVSGKLSEEFDGSYSAGEEELHKITDQLSSISTSTDFFEEEKRRQKEKREFERAENIREAVLVGEEVPKKDQNWLEKYDARLAAETKENEDEAIPEAEIQQNNEDSPQEEQSAVEAAAEESETDVAPSSDVMA